MTGYRTPAGTPCNWAGTWTDSIGRAWVLSQSGNGVSGNSGSSTLSGTLSGATLIGRYTIVGVGLIPTTNGGFVWTSAPNCNSFSGESGSGGSSTGNVLNGSRNALTAPTATPVATICAWPGTWTTGYGALTLTQTGANVTGSYGTSTVTATVSGNTLSGQWSSSGATSTGRFQFTAAANCNSFTGSWGYGTASSGAGAWNGTRSTPPL